jgi:hypothetical protein
MSEMGGGEEARLNYGISSHLREEEGVVDCQSDGLEWQGIGSHPTDGLERQRGGKERYFWYSESIDFFNYD